MTIGSAFKIVGSDTESNQSVVINIMEYNAEKILNDMIDFEISISDTNGN
ncbi:unnamed protein product, partial [marine sediment metagenome]